MSDSVNQLVSMGFSRADASNALSRVDGDVQRAVGILLGAPSYPTPDVAPTTVNLTSGDEDEELRRAIELSKELEVKEKKARGDKQRKAARAASNNAAASAALSRLNGGSITQPTKTKAAPAAVSSHPSVNGGSITQPTKTKAAPAAVSSHPSVKVPKTLAEKSYKEQVLRTVFRVSPHSLAVDTLIKTLETIKNNKTNPKYRSIDVGTRGFKRALDGVPGVTDLLTLGIGFKRDASSKSVFKLDFVDEARFYAVLSALKDLSTTSHAYNLSRSRRVWEKRLEALMADDTTTEITKRGECLRLSPSEPGTAACSFVTVNIKEGEKISRRFAADDTVKDVLYWVSGSVSSKLYDLILSDEVVLVNLSKHPKAAVNEDEPFENIVKYTLQRAELWPSCELDLVNKDIFLMDSERGRKEFEVKVSA
ncbi:hypothetical protein TrCOL_g1166 [Triparma columacea]|uniref:UBA domain-containing protein n=1 Tax=Triparma columacea TaxID=722753 RepID=A0A9W7LDX1_9STRA|nr:hypothetical protein TrCOL_g1166 [Triparma columacea]